MAKPGADRRGTHITARLSMQTKSAIGFREVSQEFCRINYGMWLDEEFNSVPFALTDTRELIVIMEADGHVVAVQNNRHGVNKYNEPGYSEIAPDKFFVRVTPVDEIYGALVTYSYEIGTKALTVSEIIWVADA